MRDLFLIILIVFSCITFSLYGAERKVLLIGIDGLRSDVAFLANTPNIKYLANNGFGTYNSWHQDITISGPSWSSILCGVYHDKHGVLDNSFNGACYTKYPMINTLGKRINPNLKFGMYMEWDKLANQCKQLQWDELIEGKLGRTGRTQREGSQWLKQTDLDFCFIYLGAADCIGHISGFSLNNPFYVNAVERIDKAVGSFIEAINSRPNYENEDWLILLTTDHGGYLFSHGGLSVSERQLVWIAYSDRIKKVKVQTVDCGNMNDACNPYTSKDYRSCPVQVDIVAASLDHLLYRENQDLYSCSNCNIEGRSWLNEMGLSNSRTNDTYIALNGSGLHGRK
ncbi:MAG: alkaline phosphatase family protein [Saprospiraceae bacterium]|nr:alkaline phosphatase family protein [Saprospiraceae bacterium]